jgi:hypothetical protein
MADAPGSRVKTHFESPLVGSVSCSQLLSSLHKTHERLEKLFPDEFKNMRRPIAGEPAGGGDDSDDSDDDDADDGRPDDHKQLDRWGVLRPPGGPRPRAAARLPAAKTEQEQTLALMQDEAVGWQLISMLWWKYKCDGAISSRVLRETLSRASGWPKMAGAQEEFHAAAVLRATRFWLERFATVARSECKAVAGWDKNCVYQLVAHGKELFEASLKTPDVLEFIQHQIQEVDLAQELAARG